LHAIADDITASGKALAEKLAKLLAEPDAESLQQARDVTRKMQFFQRLNEEVAALEDEFGDY
jgi:hypothetical protein